MSGTKRPLLLAAVLLAAWCALCVYGPTAVLGAPSATAPATVPTATAPASKPAATSRPATSSRPASSPSNAPATAPAPASAEGKESTGAIVNALIDDALAMANRMLELPLFVVLPVVGVFAAVPAVAPLVLCRKGKRPRLRWLLRAAAVAVVVLALAYVLDRKLAAVQNQLTDVRAKMDTNTAVMLETLSKKQGSRKSLLVEPKDAQAELDKQLGPTRVTAMICDEAVDYLHFHRAEPAMRAYLAVVDLTCPGLDIRLGTTLAKKRLTTEFARENDCTVAVNGEAGTSPEMGCPLGEWTGNFIDHGKVIMMADSNQRPFMSFDRTNRGKYSPAAVVDTEPTPDKFNVIWGRVDVLLAGEVVTADWRDRQPRTAMAVNKDGTRLYLLVVDGRQPNYSMGMTRAEVGKLLKAVGAWDGMMCDEGGSSCFYLKKLGGICSIPSDGRGQERPTYTHFGITVKD